MAAQKILDLIRSGMSPREAAITAGVSRQRVYQVCKRYGVTPNPSGYRERAGEPRPPSPRIMTGGIEVKVSHSTAGTVAELLVAADLLARGWLVYWPMRRDRGHDLIAVDGGTIVTIEVRSAYRNATGKLIYSRKADGKGSDHYALVVTGEPSAYEPPLPIGPRALKSCSSGRIL